MSRIYKTLTIFALTLTITASCLLGGCSLAKEEAKDAARNDLLVGAYVIPHESEDFLDLSEYIEEGNGNKIYAQVDKHDSDHVEDWTYSFPDLSGYMILMARNTDEDDETTMINFTDPEFADVKYSTDIEEDKTVNEVSATIYYTLDAYEIEESDVSGDPENPILDFDTYYLYEETDGDIYLTTEERGGTSVNHASGRPSSTHANTITTTENGKSVTEERAVTLTYQSEHLPEQTRILQMSADHKILKETSINLNKIPENMTAVKNMAYLIVESSHQSTEGKTIMDRQIYDRDDAEEEGAIDVTVFTPEAYGILKSEIIEVDLGE